MAQYRKKSVGYLSHPKGEPRIWYLLCKVVTEWREVKTHRVRSVQRKPFIKVIEERTLKAARATLEAFIAQPNVKVLEAAPWMRP